MSVLSNKFGARGAKGSDGEEFLFNKLNANYTVSDYRMNYQMQSQGIDFGIKKPDWHREFTLDAKTNLYLESDWFAFKIELQRANKAGWLFTSKSDRMYHVNSYAGKYLFYELNEMRYYITKKLLDGNFDAFKIVKMDGDTLLQFTIKKGVSHDIPVSQLYF